MPKECKEGETDISDANAVVTDVKASKTFYAVSGGKKTGTMATRTLSPDNDTVDAGYYGATTLHAVDADLAAANIKSGVNIFGIGGSLAAGYPAADATVAMFQNYPALGNFSGFPAQMNDNNTQTDASAGGENQYAQVNYGRIVNISRWRQFGDVWNNEDGRWKIQYWDLPTQAWIDWVTDIPTRGTASWSAYASQTEVITTAIRLICTVVDTGVGVNVITELEVIK